MELFPEGLTQKEFAALSKCANEVADLSVDRLLSKAEDYLKRIRMLHSKNLHINVRLAEAIVYAFQDIFDDWENVPPMHAPGAGEWFNIFVCRMMMSMIFPPQLVSKTMLR
jgi:hypothetical protein